MNKNDQEPLERMPQIFAHGSRWVRADFHLHTKADKQFAYAGEENSYLSAYVDALANAEIRVGVIANHNKFVKNEFDAMRKNARKRDIYLLPGVELSVADGANGIHTIVVFSEAWLENGQDYIYQFLNVTFAGKTPDQYENENGRSQDSLSETIKKLESYNRDFFLIFAHVEQNSGLWLELDGGRLAEVGKTDYFQRRCRGFQKVRTHDKQNAPCRMKVKEWLGASYPAEVEGSDPKRIDEIGKGEACYVKIGAFSFEAVKFALCNFENRVAREVPRHARSHIKSIRFEGGTLNGQDLSFSPGLNALIGVRGSGKSSIIEAIRFAMDIPAGDNPADDEYKRKLIKHTMGSGGKVTVIAVDRFGQEYEIRRIWDHRPEVLVNGELQPSGLSIREAVVHKPLYFGQKDLSNSGEGFEKNLVEKLIGEKSREIRLQIAEQQQKVQESIRRYLKLSNISARKEEHTSKKQNAEFQLERYKKYGLEEKLQRQVDFDADSRKLREIAESVTAFHDALTDLLMQHEDAIRNHVLYKSRQNETYFNSYFSAYASVVTQMDALKQSRDSLAESRASLAGKQAEFDQIFQGLKEEFAAIERSISDELREAGVPTIRPDEFRQLNKVLEQSRAILAELDKEQAKSEEIRQELTRELSLLNELWHKEFQIIQDEMGKVNANHSSLEIVTDFKADKAAFKVFLREILKGSALRDTTIQKLVDEFIDMHAIFEERERAEQILAESGPKFWEYFFKQLETLLIWRVPDKFTIKYGGKELKEHSLGQRASALILFVLSQRENDLILIDQPEDDLDNQTIYKDVIKLIHTLKRETQFIFATHNPNFPVLGDAEMVIACDYSNNRVDPYHRSIDDPLMQARIVNIMEGGKEAFERRKEIYSIWKPLS
ncbi:MAG TPA: histidinol-phosphatase [Candidatus Ozemobacteraceae bacterium]|nr:histidinol-phosphatase [Candidatus Ozemobacteraceae bacterium]